MRNYTAKFTLTQSVLPLLCVFKISFNTYGRDWPPHHLRTRLVLSLSPSSISHPVCLAFFHSRNVKVIYFTCAGRNLKIGHWTNIPSSSTHLEEKYIGCDKIFFFWDGRHATHFCMRRINNAVCPCCRRREIELFEKKAKRKLIHRNHAVLSIIDSTFRRVHRNSCLHSPLACVYLRINSAHTHTHTFTFA